jgi:hypothetical protein
LRYPQTADERLKQQPQEASFLQARVIRCNNP